MEMGRQTSVPGSRLRRRGRAGIWARVPGCVQGVCKDGQFLDGGFLLKPHRPVCAVFGRKLRWEGGGEKVGGEWEEEIKEEGGNIGQKNRYAL